MEAIKIGALGICGVLLAVYFKSIKAEYGVYIGIVTGLLIFFYTLKNLSYFMEQLAAMKLLMQGEEGFLTILLKVVGITYICEFSAGICRDAGYGAVAGQIEIFGKIIVLMAGLPILTSVLQAVQNFSG